MWNRGPWRICALTWYHLEIVMLLLKKVHNFYQGLNLSNRIRIEILTVPPEDYCNWMKESLCLTLNGEGASFGQEICGAGSTGPKIWSHAHLMLSIWNAYCQERTLLTLSINISTHHLRQGEIHSCQSISHYLATFRGRPNLLIQLRKQGQGC